MNLDFLDFHLKSVFLYQLAFEEMLRKMEPLKAGWSHTVLDIEGSLSASPSEALAQLRVHDPSLHPLDWQDESHIAIAHNAFDISVCYCRGRVIAKDTTKGLAWLAFAALLGNDIAMSMYQPIEDSLGIELPQPLPRRLWLLLSSVKGFRESYACLKRHFPDDLASVKAIMSCEQTLHQDSSNHADTKGDPPFATAQRSDVTFTVSLFSAKETTMLLQDLPKEEGGMVRSLQWPWQQWRFPEGRIPQV